MFYSNFVRNKKRFYSYIKTNLRSPKSSLYLTGFIGLLILATDQIIKHLLISHLHFGESIRGIFFDITLVKNTGTAFGLFFGNNIFFIASSIITIVVISIVLFKSRKSNFLFKLCFIFVLFGALSNLLDRVKFGYVVDYIDFRFWPVFNIADSAITIGVIVLVISMLMNKKI